MVDPVSISKEAAMRRYRVVVIKCPYDTIETDLTVGFLGKIARFKIASYREVYPYGMLPVDSLDFVGTHFLVCEQTPQGLEPVMGFKTVTNELCRAFQIEYPLLHCIDPQKYPDQHAEAVRVLEASHASNTRLGYYGSWTINSKLRKRRDLSKVMQDLTTLLVVRAAQLDGFSQALTIAVTKFKVDQYHRFLGMPPLRSGGQVLPPFITDAAMGEECSLSELTVAGFSPEARRVADDYQTFWEERLEIRAGEAVARKAAA